MVFDNNYRPRLWASPEEAQQAFQLTYALASVALVTLDDELALHGRSDAAAQLHDTLALPCPELVVKRGASSTLVRAAGSDLVEVATERVARVVDTTAAGDSFAGGLPGSAAGRPPARRRPPPPATGLAARVVQHRGAVIPLQAMADLLEA